MAPERTHYLPKRHQFPSEALASASVVRCVARSLESDATEPRAAGHANMDLRRVLGSVLWILLLNIEGDCHAEEGMCSFKRRTNLFIFLCLVVEV